LVGCASRAVSINEHLFGGGNCVCPLDRHLRVVVDVGWRPSQYQLLRTAQLTAMFSAEVDLIDIANRIKANHVNLLGGPKK